MNDINNQYQRVAGNKTNNVQDKAANQSQEVQQHTNVAKTQKATEQAKTAPTQGAVQAKFTPESQALLRMNQASKDVSDINQKKVDRIKQVLEAGIQAPQRKRPRGFSSLASAQTTQCTDHSVV